MEGLHSLSCFTGVDKFSARPQGERLQRMSMDWGVGVLHVSWRGSFARNRKLLNNDGRYSFVLTGW